MRKTTKRVQRWCDRCGDEIELESQGAPQGMHGEVHLKWRGWATSWSGDKGGGSKEVRADLCGDCVNGLRRFLEGDK